MNDIIFTHITKRIQKIRLYNCRDYILSYDKRNRTAHWVFEHLTRESVARNEEVDRNKSNFVEDSSIHPYFRSKNSDYKVRVE